MTTISNYKKHLKLSEKIKIVKALVNNTSFRNISKDINNGHLFTLIVYNHPELNVSKRTLYNYQEQDYLETKNIYLPRKIKHKNLLIKINIF